MRSDYMRVAARRLVGSPVIAASGSGLCAADRRDAETGDLQFIAERVVHIHAERAAVPHVLDAHGGKLCFGPLAVEIRSEEHTSELQSHLNLVCRLLLEKKKNKNA